MRAYIIRRAQRSGENYESMVIVDRTTKEHIAEYRLTPGEESAEIKGMRAAIDEHLDNGGTMGNYQW